MNRHRSRLATAALAALVVALSVYGLVFYDGRSKTERIVDCVHGAGYTTSVSHDPGHNGIYNTGDSFAAPVVLPPTPPSTTITVYASPADSPLLPRPQDDHVWWV